MTIRILDTQKMRSGLVIGKTNTGLSIWVAAGMNHQDMVWQLEKLKMLILSGGV